MMQLVPAFYFRDQINIDKSRASAAGLELYLLMFTDQTEDEDEYLLYDFEADKFAWEDISVPEKFKTGLRKHFHAAGEPELFKGFRIEEIQRVEV